MASVTFDDVTKRFDADLVAVDDLRARDRGRRVPRPCRPLRLRQEHGAANARRPRTTSPTAAILIGDRVVNNVAPASRDLAMVFQSYALYPHMTVYDNLAFGLRNHEGPEGRDRASRRRRGEDPRPQRADQAQAEAALRRQRQRVALGRAIVREPSAFLMDEPLSNLDAALRVADAGGDPEAPAPPRHDDDLRDARSGRGDDDGRPHRRDEALACCSRSGRPEELYTRPTNIFVARFIGSPSMNMVPAGLIEDRGLRRDARRLPSGARRPRQRPCPTPLGYEALVEVVEYLGDEQLVHLRLKDTPLLAKLDIEQQVTPGEQSTFRIPQDKLHLFRRRDRASPAFLGD